MRTWDDYKKHAKAASSESAKDVEEIERLAAIAVSILPDTPNDETLKAMAESEKIARDPHIKGFTDMASLLASLDGK